MTSEVGTDEAVRARVVGSALGAEMATRADAPGAAERERVLRQALESRGQRYTEQRAAVYGYLDGKRTHPTADEVFTAVRAEIPDISLATVYKALEALVGCGLAVKLHCGDAAARYDGRTDPHSHAHCRICGAVVDVPGPMPAPEAGVLAAVAGFVVEGWRVELVGRCASCG